MKTPRPREFIPGPDRRHLALLLSFCAALAVLVAGTLQGADEIAPNPSPVLKQYCVQCHRGATPMGGVSLQQLTSQASVGESFSTWGRVATVLEQHRMPPQGMPQPSDVQRQQAVAWIRAQLNAYAKKHDGDPGRVTVRRLTSGEYVYTIHDLTGIDLDAGIDAASDSAGGEGFTSFGDVQLMQYANPERSLGPAKIVANHAVIGAGPR